MRKRDMDAVMRRFLGEAGPPPPRCATCGRAFGSVFDVPRVTVLAVRQLDPKRGVRDWMAGEGRKRAPARSLPTLLRAPSMVEYLRSLRLRVGKTVKPAALLPRWSREDEWRAPAVPGAPRKPSDNWTYWTLTFATRWDARRPEAVLVVKAAIGGHSLGGQYGPVTIETAPIIRVRVRAHLQASGARSPT